MIKEGTLKELLELIPFQEFVDVITMQAILHTTKPTLKDLKKSNGFTEKCYRKFSGLLEHDNERAKIATERLLACSEYEQRKSLKGLGGCVEKPLAELLGLSSKYPVDASQQIIMKTANEIYEMLADWFGNYNVPTNILGDIRKRYGI